MVHRLDPLDLGLDFNDRSYRLGETIDVRVEITAKGRIAIREAGVELLCDQTFAETYTISGPGRYSNTAGTAPRPGYFESGRRRAARELCPQPNSLPLRLDAGVR